MNRSPVRLLASSLFFEVAPVEPEGVYDPIEQLWRDDGMVLASSCNPITCEIHCVRKGCIAGVCTNGTCRCFDCLCTEMERVNDEFSKRKF